jgi:hypothetical protein
MTDQIAPTQLSSAEQHALRQAFDHMPYAAAVSMRLSANLDVPELVEALNGLRETLRYYAAEHDATERELRDLRGQRDAVRAFLGLDQLLAPATEEATA